LTIDQVLLIFEASIYRQQYVEFSCFCPFQKVPVLKSCKPGVPSGLALVSWQVMAQLLVYTLIK
jgi:hypothetical protein